MTKLLKLIFLIISLFFIQACSLNKNEMKSIVQTNSASQIESFKTEVLKDLILYKKKLDLRNPNAFNKDLKNSIIQQIKENKNFINLVQNSKVLVTPNEYFYYAFSTQKINNRNDLLILGLYKLIFDAYKMDEKHQFSAIEYDKKKMIKLYEYLQIVRWKIRTTKDDKENYLFNTWQNNWQLELAKKYQGDYNIINELSYIKTNNESIYDPSNFSYEIVISRMITNVEHTLRKINIEPYEMSVSVLKGFIFII
ncbi:hypothetical protein [Arcobacter cloacae]|uniref:Lipoprotein n=1 Tax=Arcobacter cloacae TaxID=1054034 RepID=A0A4Q0ZBA3_9BACT|nr:hypothetical protein [Arcobacter cloacae]RXJ83554.1 hypothetical protein CRU90_09195 [Arcobacter cloacae]